MWQARCVSNNSAIKFSISSSSWFRSGLSRRVIIIGIMFRCKVSGARDFWNLSLRLDSRWLEITWEQIPDRYVMCDRMQWTTNNYYALPLSLSLSLSRSLAQTVLLIMQLRVCTNVTVAGVRSIFPDTFVQTGNKRGVCREIFTTTACSRLQAAIDR